MLIKLFEEKYECGDTDTLLIIGKQLSDIATLFEGVIKTVVITKEINEFVNMRQSKNYEREIIYTDDNTKDVMRGIKYYDIGVDDAKEKIKEEYKEKQLIEILDNGKYYDSWHFLVKYNVNEVVVEFKDEKLLDLILNNNCRVIGNEETINGEKVYSVVMG